jgi:hypothetical protein
VEDLILSAIQCSISSDWRSAELGLNVTVLPALRSDTLLLPPPHTHCFAFGVQRKSNTGYLCFILGTTERLQLLYQSDFERSIVWLSSSDYLPLVHCQRYYTLYSTKIQKDIPKVITKSESISRMNLDKIIVPEFKGNFLSMQSASMKQFSTWANIQNAPRAIPMQHLKLNDSEALESRQCIHSSIQSLPYCDWPMETDCWPAVLG